MISVKDAPKKIKLSELKTGMCFRLLDNEDEENFFYIKMNNLEVDSICCLKVFEDDLIPVFFASNTFVKRVILVNLKIDALITYTDRKD